MLNLIETIIVLWESQLGLACLYKNLQKYQTIIG